MGWRRRRLRRVYYVAGSRVPRPLWLGWASVVMMLSVLLGALVALEVVR